jgi:hypothetical protein
VSAWATLWTQRRGSLERGWEAVSDGNLRQNFRRNEREPSGITSGWSVGGDIVRKVAISDGGGEAKSGSVWSSQWLKTVDAVCA